MTCWLHILVFATSVVLLKYICQFPKFHCAAYSLLAQNDCSKCVLHAPPDVFLLKTEKC
jgi:hypothetical protein